jgi:hypothetical protein
MMRRREFITLLGGAAVAWPFAARAQQGERMRRIGVLVAATPDDPEYERRMAAFRQALALSGWTDGRSFANRRLSWQHWRRQTWRVRVAMPQAFSCSNMA